MTEDVADTEELLSDVAYVMGSQYRLAVVRTLSKGPTTPSDISDVHTVSLSHVSRALSELRDRNVVESYGEQSRTKLYDLTEYGDKVVEELDDFESKEEQ